MTTIESHLPLTETAFEILLSLLEEDRHGYAILQSIAERTDGRIQLHAGTLYRALSRMLDEAWIEELDVHDPADASADGRRRTYRITRHGREIARAEARRISSQLAVARSRRLISDTELSG